MKMSTICIVSLPMMVVNNVQNVVNIVKERPPKGNVNT